MYFNLGNCVGSFCLIVFFFMVIVTIKYDVYSLDFLSVIIAFTGPQ